MRKHINRLIIDARDLSVFIVLLILVMATVVSIPRLLKGLPGRMRSLRTANYFLAGLLSDLLWTILGFIMRLCSCNVLIIAINLGLFSVFTPATCVADSLCPVENEEEEIAMRKLIAEEEKVALGVQRRVAVPVRNESNRSGMLHLILLGLAVWGGSAIAAAFLTSKAVEVGDAKPEDTEAMLSFAIYFWELSQLTSSSFSFYLLIEELCSSPWASSKREVILVRPSAKHTFMPS